MPCWSVKTSRSGARGGVCSRPAGVNTLEKTASDDAGVATEENSTDLGELLDLELDANEVSFTERTGRALVAEGVLFALGSTKGVN